MVLIWQRVSGSCCIALQTLHYASWSDSRSRFGLSYRCKSCAYPRRKKISTRFLFVGSSERSLSSWCRLCHQYSVEEIGRVSRTIVPLIYICQALLFVVGHGSALHRVQCNRLRLPKIGSQSTRARDGKEIVSADNQNLSAKCRGAEWDSTNTNAAVGGQYVPLSRSLMHYRPR
jgi:hypothetical protein